MKKSQSFRSLIGIAAVTTGLVATGGCGSEPESAPETAAPRPAKIVTVGRSESGTRTYPGRSQAPRSVALSFRVGGPVVEIRPSKGQRVANGDLLARIDGRDYRVQVKNAEAQLAAARAHGVQATESYQRVRGLYENDNASKADFDNARASLEVSVAQVEAAEQALMAARLSLADTELTAPFDGIVADRLVEEHATVVPGQPILAFQGIGGMEVLVHVPEREVADLTRKASARIEVRFDALVHHDPLVAYVKEFATETDPVTQTFPITLSLEGKVPTGLLAGMTASVTWSLGNGDRSPGNIVVPLGAVGSDVSGSNFVWRVNPATMELQRVDVTTGELTDSGLEVLSGLAVGDSVLATGVDFAREGQLVRPLASAGD